MMTLPLSTVRYEAIVPSVAIPGIIFVEEGRELLMPSQPAMQLKAIIASQF